VTKLRKPPIRTCVACRTTSDKRALVRVVRTPEGDVHVDPSGKANGRGAYVCLAPGCFDSAVAKRRFDGALRVNLKEDDLDQLRREFDEACTTRSASADAGRDGDTCLR
jgi:predicted RNA-binding protein YlxR (DUF448 family)